MWEKESNEIILTNKFEDVISNLKCTNEEK